MFFTPKNAMKSHIWNLYLNRHYKSLCFSKTHNPKKYFTSCLQSEHWWVCPYGAKHKMAAAWKRKVMIITKFCLHTFKNHSIYIICVSKCLIKIIFHLIYTYKKHLTACLLFVREWLCLNGAKNLKWRPLENKKL